ncbi:hypothetical protein PUN28_002200 [Cardiocondyla obscurior]|uniref:Uncharacterized protein n=1 Tax=Cardiocondyla obscurior TaxID=286306 RepID=A0AAW2GT40_9HYME
MVSSLLLDKVSVAGYGVLPEMVLVCSSAGIVLRDILQILLSQNHGKLRQAVLLAQADNRSKVAAQMSIQRVIVSCDFTDLIFATAASCCWT